MKLPVYNFKIKKKKKKIGKNFFFSREETAYELSELLGLDEYTFNPHLLYKEVLGTWDKNNKEYD